MGHALARSEEYASSARDEVIERYRHLRRISKAHHSAILRFLSKDAVLGAARRLGLAHGRTFVLDDMDELTLAFDLAIHTAPAGRSRAIDRYARTAHCADGSDEALVLEAMRGARFGAISVKRRHPSAGLIVVDVFRDVEFWLVDEGLEGSLSEGMSLATRYYTPDRFAMTAGVVVPADLDFLATAVESAPYLMRKEPGEAIEDPRFAEAVYRTALAEGVMANVQYKDQDVA